MRYAYKHAEMLGALEQLLLRTLPAAQWQWLQDSRANYHEGEATALFNRTFTAVPRFIQKGSVHPVSAETEKLHDARTGFQLNGWSVQRVARTWWLLQLAAGDEDRYVDQIESLFKAAGMNEQVALYGSLPLLAFPQRFIHRCTEGVRTNMAVVFEAVALDNPYPSEYLDEAAWNQLVLKAFFMQMPVNRIIGLDKRANASLARMLTDYAHERLAAGRSVDPLLWRPVGEFIDAQIFPDIDRLFRSDSETEVKAASLASFRSTYEPATRLLDARPAYRQMIRQGQLTWESLASPDAAAGTTSKT